MKTTLMTIKCPYCGAEYLPEEIFMGDEFLGNSKVIKDENEHIVSVVEQNDAELYASYVCDCCNKRFTVKAEVKFESEKDEFEDDYSIKL